MKDALRAIATGVGTRGESTNSQGVPWRDLGNGWTRMVSNTGSTRGRLRARPAAELLGKAQPSGLRPLGLVAPARAVRLRCEGATWAVVDANEERST